MKIVVLDGLTANPGDISWKPLEDIGELTVYDYTAVEDIPKRSKGAQILVSNKTIYSEETLRQLADVKFIGLMSTGYNVVDIDAAARCGITVANVPGYSTDSVAQHTFAFILEFANAIGIHSNAVHNGEWSDKKRFCFWKIPIFELYGKTIGIIGFGAIGQRVAEIAKVFGMKVLYYSRTPKQNELGTYTQLDELLANSDFVSVHCPLTGETRELINKTTISKMKKGAVLINTSRGQVVNDGDLAYALNTGYLSGAGIDVMTTEPPVADNPLLTAKNCLITPHIAWAGRETRARMLDMVADNINSFLVGAPKNKVN